MKERGNKRNVETIDSWQFDNQNQRDVVFLSKFAAPYFSDVYKSLAERGGNSYLFEKNLKTYLNLPEILSNRILSGLPTHNYGEIEHD